MTITHWSTRTVRARDRFAFWREAVCQAVLNVATEHPSEDFCGEISCSRYGDLRFASFASTPHEVIRLKSHIGRSCEAHYLVSWQREGSCRMFQGDAACELHPGDIGLVDGRRLFRVEFLQPVNRVIAVIPHAQLHGRAPWLERRPLNRIDGTSPLSGALRFYLARLTASACTSDGEAATLTENACNLVALMTARSESERSSARRFALQPGLGEILATLRLYLADPELSPKMLAERLGVSVRTLHKRFEASDTSFGK
jgi:hypothetical protein